MYKESSRFKICFIYNLFELQLWMESLLKLTSEYDLYFQGFKSYNGCSLESLRFIP